MADEATLRAEFAFTKAQNKASFDLATYYLTVAGDGRYGPTIWQVGTSEEDLLIVDVTTPGFLWLRNVDATNFVTWGKKVAGAMEAVGKLLPVTSATRPPPPTIVYLTTSVTIRAQANVAACGVEVLVLPQ